MTSRDDFRVGVTGARRLAPDQIARVVASVRTVLDTILQTVASRDPARATSLRVVSPLAEGADRIVAREAVARGFALDVPMPFDRAAYEATFDDASPTGLAEFRELLSRAEGRAFVLGGDGADEDGRRRSYRALGRMVVRHSDLMIAVWDDGQPAQGPGGTRDTLHYALRIGVPVWWIHTEQDRRPALLRDEAGIADHRECEGTDVTEQLHATIGAILDPTDPRRPASADKG